MSKALASGNYVHWFGEIKNRIRSSQQKAALAVNRELLDLYWFIGEALVAKQTEWGDKFIDNLARDLKVEFPDMKGFSKRNLETIRRWYSFYSINLDIAQHAVAQLQIDPNFSNAQQIVAQSEQTGQQPVDQNVKALLYSVPWGQHTVILTKVKSPEEAFFYLVKTVQNNWSRSNLTQHISTELYNRQGKALTNFALTLPEPQADLAQEIIKNPYNFDFLTLAEDARELEVERALIQHLKKFMLELGKGFAFVGNQYNLNVEGDDFFLDLLFFNMTLNRYVIFELKVGEFKPEFAGKLNMYVNTVNEHVKLPHHEETIGVLLCKTPNKTVVEYSIKGIQTPLGVSEYSFQTALPEELVVGLPTVEQLEEEIAAEMKILKDPLDEKRAKILELINSKAKEEVKIQRSQEVIAEFVKNVFHPLRNQIIQLLEQNNVKDWFLEFKEEYTLNNQIYEFKTNFDIFSQHDHNIHQIGYEIYLNGFKHAGTNTFGSRETIKFNFHQYVFSVQIQHEQKPFKEFLYSTKITDGEINEISIAFVSDMMDQIHNDAERQLSTE
ncbi:PDDEXK nuclease domain-containing protein [Flavobacterium sp.]|uniref:PDDEXK nuclease domain-containing protein n=1 Tax=Flavobacterium sp. TaxID=239 RepID=UPI0025E0571F|nr:PDDEXK nuclease domain-containing protein [Flavobacterium sp.]